MGANTKIERPHRIALRLSDEEKQILDEATELDGLDTSDVVRLSLRMYREARRPEKRASRKR